MHIALNRRLWEDSYNSLPLELAAPALAGSDPETTLPNYSSLIHPNWGRCRVEQALRLNTRTVRYAKQHKAQAVYDSSLPFSIHVRIFVYYPQVPLHAWGLFHCYLPLLIPCPCAGHLKAAALQQKVGEGSRCFE